MTAGERQAAAARVLVTLEPNKHHEITCPAWISPSFMPSFTPPGPCDCFVMGKAMAQAAALDRAGLLCALCEATS